MSAAEKTLQEDSLYRTGSSFPVYSFRCPVLQVWISGLTDTFTTSALARDGILEELTGLINRAYSFFRLNNVPPSGKVATIFLKQ